MNSDTDDRVGVGLPTLIVISGPTGSGKTALAHALASAIGCPAICRDEIKEGMVHADPSFESGWPGDPLTQRTYSAFFQVLELLLKAGVTVVAEAAFQDRPWRAGLAQLKGLADLRIVQCSVDPATAYSRSIRRRSANPVRRAHADEYMPRSLEEAVERYDSFVRLSLPAPAIAVDTTQGYQPGIEEIVAFVRR